MARLPVLVAYHLETRGPLAIGPSGLPVDVRGGPVLRATTIKGAARQAAVQLAAALGQPPCSGDGDPSCALCRLFGAPGMEAALRWLDATLDGEAVPAEVPAATAPFTEPRLRRPTDRARRSGEQEPRLDYLAALPGLRFAGRVEGQLVENEPTAKADLALLVGALMALRRIGGQRSVGCGGVALQPTTIELAGRPLAVAEALGALPGGRR